MKSYFKFLSHNKLYTAIEAFGLSVALAFVIVLFSGLLPAIVVSRFNPIDVVKGTLRLRSKMWFSKIFIVAQSAVGMALVVMAITMALQMHYLYFADSLRISHRVYATCCHEESD